MSVWEERWHPLREEWVIVAAHRQGRPFPSRRLPPSPVFQNRSTRGLARVVCYSPRHDTTLAELPAADVENLVKVWQRQYRDLGERPGIDHVLVFENKGEVVGVSNPHPHCQIYATNFVFKTIETEARVSARHLAQTGRVLFQEILEAEPAAGPEIGGGNFLSDTSPEEKAAELRALPDVHYSKAAGTPA